MLTSEQKAHLEKLNPGLAKRWGAQDSRGIPPKKRTDATDFKGLIPGQKARHGKSPASNEREAMGEGHGIKFMPGSKPGPLKKGS
jgi:hypothetical protein